MSAAYSKYVPENERPVITGLIKGLLDKGYLLAVHDGEEYVSKRTDKLTLLRPALGGTGEDWLKVWRPLEDGSREYMGYWWLIYNNGSEDDPMIVISDWSYSEGDQYQQDADEIYKELESKYGE